MTVEQQTAGIAAQFWIDCAREAKTAAEREQHTLRAIRNLMVASHGR
jgi:hypothetical protein